MERLISLLGLLTMVALAWLMSSDRTKFSPRVVLGGLFLQFSLALLILKTGPGQLVFQRIGEFFEALLGFVDAGSVFVFGDDFAEHFFAFKVLPTIIFFSSLMSVLYHLGIVQKVVAAFAWVMQKTLTTSGAETLSAAANVFVGQTEAPLVVRPYIASMTQSELMALMVGGFATVSGGVLAGYVNLGISAGHLVTASVISAPAALLIAKILQPETEHPKTLGHVTIKVPRTSANLIEAAAIGAADGVKLALNVEDRQGLLAKIVSTIAEEKTNIKNVDAQTFGGSKARVTLVVSVVDRRQMERVMGRIRKIRGVREVARVLR